MKLLSPTGDLWVRGSDPIAPDGGAFGATRAKWVKKGGRRVRVEYPHKGTDLVGNPWITPLINPHRGEVTKIGIAYPREFRFHSLHIEFGHGGIHYKVVLLYVWPFCQVGDTVKQGTDIALLEDLRIRYPKVTPHVHMEVFRDGKRVDPMDYLVESFRCQT